ncbi:MAG: helix-turn-helix domain-containing protein [Luminiphilus sp.]
MVTEAQSEPTLLKLGDLAERWSISRQHVYRLKNRGEIPYIKIGAGYYVNLEQIKEIERGQSSEED